MGCFTTQLQTFPCGLWWECLVVCLIYELKLDIFGFWHVIYCMIHNVEVSSGMHWVAGRGKSVLLSTFVLYHYSIFSIFLATFVAFWCSQPKDLTVHGCILHFLFLHCLLILLLTFYDLTVILIRCSMENAKFFAPSAHSQILTNTFQLQ